MKIILLHGMGGSPADWDLVMRELPPGNAEAWELPSEEYFDDAATALAHLLAKEKGAYGIAGYSLGGRLAIRATQYLLYLNPPKRVVLLGAGLGFASRAERSERESADKNWAAQAAQDPETFWKKWYAQGLFAEFAALPEATQLAWMKSRRALAPEILQRQLVGWSPAQHDLLLPDLREIVDARISTLYIAGERDKKYAQLAKDLGREGLQIQTISGAGHILPLEAPAAVAASLHHFFGE